MNSEKAGSGNGVNTQTLRGCDNKMTYKMTKQ
jgi:hypothetical protein